MLCQLLAIELFMEMVQMIAVATDGLIMDFK